MSNRSFIVIIAGLSAALILAGLLGWAVFDAQWPSDDAPLWTIAK